MKVLAFLMLMSGISMVKGLYTTNFVLHSIDQEIYPKMIKLVSNLSILFKHNWQTKSGNSILGPSSIWARNEWISSPEDSTLWFHMDSSIGKKDRRVEKWSS